MRQRQVPATYRIWHPETDQIFDGTKAQIAVMIGVSHQSVFLMIKGLLKPRGWELVAQLSEKRPVRYLFQNGYGHTFEGNSQEAAIAFDVSVHTIHSIIHRRTRNNECGWFLVRCLDQEE